MCVHVIVIRLILDHIGKPLFPHSMGIGCVIGYNVLDNYNT